MGRLGDSHRLLAVEYRPIGRRDKGRPRQRWKNEHFLKVIRPRCVQCNRKHKYSVLRTIQQNQLHVSANI